MRHTLLSHTTAHVTVNLAGSLILMRLLHLSWVFVRSQGLIKQQTLDLMTRSVTWCSGACALAVLQPALSCGKLQVCVQMDYF